MLGATAEREDERARKRAVGREPRRLRVPAQRMLVTVWNDGRVSLARHVELSEHDGREGRDRRHRESTSRQHREQHRVSRAERRRIARGFEIDVGIVLAEDLTAVRQRTEIGEADETAASRHDRQDRLLPDLTAARSAPPHLDDVMVRRRGAIRRHDQ